MTKQRLLPQWTCLPLLAIPVLFASACSTLPNGERWGENVSFPGWERLKSTTWKVARDPHTWVPLAGAAVLSIGDLDEDLSDWAVREHPLFGGGMLTFHIPF